MAASDLPVPGLPSEEWLEFGRRAMGLPSVEEVEQKATQAAQKPLEQAGRAFGQGAGAAAVDAVPKGFWAGLHPVFKIGLGVVAIGGAVLGVGALRRGGAKGT